MSALQDDFAFKPGTELLADRARAREAVDACLGSLREGVLPDDAERQRTDFKEEAGRRAAGGHLLPGSAENTKAADQLADEVAAMANTPGGGALIVGVENRSGDLLGTELDVEWLRQQIYWRVDVAPEIEEIHEQGIRLLMIYVAEARERWRTPVAESAGESVPHPSPSIEVSGGLTVKIAVVGIPWRD